MGYTSIVSIVLYCIALYCIVWYCIMYYTDNSKQYTIQITVYRNKNINRTSLIIYIRLISWYSPNNISCSERYNNSNLFYNGKNSVNIRSHTWYSIHRILVGDGDSILCTKQFVGSDSVSLGCLVVAMGDSRLDWWRPRVVTREVGVVWRVSLKKTDVCWVMG